MRIQRGKFRRWYAPLKVVEAMMFRLMSYWVKAFAIQASCSSRSLPGCLTSIMPTLNKAMGIVGIR